MNTNEAFKISMDMSDLVLKTYISDLTDSELLTRSVPGVNHLAWQLGHLISSENNLLNAVCPDAGCELPAEFAEQHNRESVDNDNPSDFLTKQQYIDLYDQMRQATKAALDGMSAEQFDRPAPDQFKNFAPTVGAVFNLIALHPMMHAGQFATARRALGKPVLL